MQNVRGGDELGLFREQREAGVSSACDRPGQASRREIELAGAGRSEEFGFHFDFHGNPRKFLEGRSRA